MGMEVAQAIVGGSTRQRFFGYFLRFRGDTHRRNHVSVALSGALRKAHPAKFVEKLSQTLLTRVAKTL